MENVTRIFFFHFFEFNDQITQEGNACVNKIVPVQTAPGISTGSKVLSAFMSSSIYQLPVILTALLRVA